MLSGQEEQAFAQIAEQIAVDDPQFAVSIGRLQSRRAGRGHHVVVVVAAAGSPQAAQTPLRGQWSSVRRA